MEKVALVTGASRGIGKACALRLAECGYDIVVNYNSNEAKAQEVVSAIEALGQKAVAIKANTADLKEVQNMFREAHKAFGRLDVLVNNAGVVDDAFLLMINGFPHEKPGHQHQGILPLRTAGGAQDDEQEAGRYNQCFLCKLHSRR
ncbi:MAG: SDR family NAD(P)-dependent oxidoreductase [Oscillospiraceae bacterium]